ncbi:MAG: 30S ribosomal protein S19 [Phycisphaeraceae bacterium]|nr:30S ribosomal protein S19 [Phycisphaerae bacterium]MBX3391387.1 30S ribosomal protein S19 [Phycisphaeraceae bacterium]
MGRSQKKGPYVDERLYHRVENLNATRKKEPLKTWARRCTIVPEFVGHTFKVHNGRAFIDVFVTEDMVGHKLGEFSISRTFRGHTNKKEGIEGGDKSAPPRR